MENINSWGDLVYNSLNDILFQASKVVPNIIGALVVLIFGWLFTKLLTYVLKKALKLVKIDSLTQKLNKVDIFEGSNINFNITNVIVGFVKFALFLVFLIVAFGILNWESVSLEIANLLRYLPKLFSAIALFLVGLYVARFVKKAIQDLFGTFDKAGSSIIASIVFYLIAIIVTITSLNQAGIETTIITNNLSIILGAFLLAFAIAFGFGSRNVIESLLLSFYSKQNFEIGDEIVVDDINGEIISINNISVSLKTKEGTVIIPIKELTDKRIIVK